MKLREIHIKNYKSILTWQNITMKGNILVFVGKNGSGKTNLLESIELLFAKRNNYYYHQFKEYDFKFVFEISKQKLKEINNTIEYNNESKFFEVYYENGHDSLRPKYLKNKILSDALKRNFGSAKDIADQLLKKLNEYDDIVKQISNAEFFYGLNFGVTVEDLNSISSHRHVYNHQISKIHDLIKDITKVYESILPDGNDEIYFPQIYPSDYLYDEKSFVFALKYIRP